MPTEGMSLGLTSAKEAQAIPKAHSSNLGQACIYVCVSMIVYLNVCLWLCKCVRGNVWMCECVSICV